MTTAAAERLYEAQHVHQWEGKGWAAFNPENRPFNELPIIYGFNNGGSHGFMSAVLITEDGTWIGSHLCSSEAYMPHDLGILEGAMPARHEEFRKHYPNGYRMEFVGYDAAWSHEGLKTAVERSKAKTESKE